MMVSMAVIATLLVLAVLFLALGSLRGSFRFWLVGYALVVAGLVVVYARIHATRSATPAAQEAPQSGARS